ncbi:MAG: family 20 glycosylhydrolase [Clostridia bacterium]|nr:family 20 glycosylhydrolase [Clostridia bacterium]
MKHRIYPAPVSENYTGGTFPFGSKVLLRISDDFTNDGYISKMKELWYGFCYECSSLQIETDKSLAPHSFAIGDFSISDKEPSEYEYILKITDSGVSAKGYSDKEVLYSFYTLLQMLKIESLDEGEESFYIDCGEIIDKPAIKFRSLIFCVHPYTSLTLLRKQVRLAGLMKFTHILFEYWGSLKLDSLPELAWENAHTKEQMKPIIQDAIDMGMEVVPIFNHLGHASGSEMLACKHVVLDQNPRLAPLFENSGWSFCVSNERTKNLLKAIRSELIDFSGKGSYFHIGMDEAHDFGRCDRCSQFAPEELLSNFVNEVSADLKAQGRQTLMWADMLTYKEDFKKYNTQKDGRTNLLVANGEDTCPTHKALKYINKDVILVDWQYLYVGDYDEPLHTSVYLKENGFKTISAAWKNFQNVTYLCTEIAKNNSFGYMAAIWQSVVDNPEMIPFASEAAWLGEKAQFMDTNRHALWFYNTANLQRRLLLHCDNYEDAGMMGTLPTMTKFC